MRTVWQHNNYNDHLVCFICHLTFSRFDCVLCVQIVHQKKKCRNIQARKISIKTIFLVKWIQYFVMPTNCKTGNPVNWYELTWGNHIRFDTFNREYNVFDDNLYWSWDNSVWFWSEIRILYESLDLNFKIGQCFQLHVEHSLYIGSLGPYKENLS